MAGFDPVSAIGGGVISGAGALLDARLNRSAMRESNDFNSVQAAVNRAFQADQAKLDREMQYDFAKNGIRMRVADAVAAGLHPLVGAGVTPYQGSPVSVGGSQASSSGYASSHMGQDISRAVLASRTETERADELLRLQLLKSQIAETDMRSKLLDAQIQKLKQGMVSAGPFPDGAGQVTVIPDQKVSQALDDSSRTAGSHPFFKNYETGIPGVTIDIPYSQDGPAEGLEGMGALAATLLRNLMVRPAKWWSENASKRIKEAYGGIPTGEEVVRDLRRPRLLLAPSH